MYMKVCVFFLCEQVRECVSVCVCVCVQASACVCECALTRLLFGVGSVHCLLVSYTNPSRELFDFAFVSF